MMKASQSKLDKRITIDLTRRLTRGMEYLRQTEEITMSSYVRGLIRKDMIKRGIWDLPEVVGGAT